MRPIPWNKAYRAKNGNLMNVEEAMGGGGGGSSLPPYSAADAGKVLGVTEQGTLAWGTVSGGGGFTVVNGGNQFTYPTPTIEEVTP